MSHSRRRHHWSLPKPKFKRATKALDCCEGPDCGCGGCDLFFIVLITAALHYFQTAPVTEGRKSVRPVLRLIRSYQHHVSANRPAVCNLAPTCSRYGYETLRERGLRGVPAIRRRLRDCRIAGRSRHNHDH